MMGAAKHVSYNENKTQNICEVWWSFGYFTRPGSMNIAAGAMSNTEIGNEWYWRSLRYWHIFFRQRIAYAAFGFASARPMSIGTCKWGATVEWVGWAFCGFCRVHSFAYRRSSWLWCSLAFCVSLQHSAASVRDYKSNSIVIAFIAMLFWIVDGRSDYSREYIYECIYTI